MKKRNILELVVKQNTEKPGTKQAEKPGTEQAKADDSERRLKLGICLV